MSVENMYYYHVETFLFEKTRFAQPLFCMSFYATYCCGCGRVSKSRDHVQEDMHLAVVCVGYHKSVD